MKFDKPALSISEQIQHLKERNLKFEDEERAQHYLTNISYYRLSAYMLFFQYEEDPKHNFVEGTTFNQVLDSYVFDRELRVHIIDAIERIEISIRALMINNLCEAYGTHWYENPELFIKRQIHTQHLSSLDKECQRSHEKFIRHYKKKYTDPERPPAWMTIEISSFGLLSKLYDNLKRIKEKKDIAHHFGLSPEVLVSWLRAITYLRNLCAHHSRVWNRLFTVTPLQPKSIKKEWLKNDELDNRKLYYSLSCIMFLLKTINPKTKFPDYISEHISKYPDMDIQFMGFPENWQEETLWESNHIDETTIDTVKE